MSSSSPDRRPSRWVRALPEGHRTDLVLLALTGLLLLLLPHPLRGQGGGLHGLLEQCLQVAGEGSASRCEDAALALEAYHGGVGLLMSAGGPIPVSPSTAGRRVGQSPRVVVDLALLGASFRHPELDRPQGGGGGSLRRTTLPGVRVATAIGLFPGFSPVATVGGVLSLDAVGALQLLQLPSQEGGRIWDTAYGAGLRLGIFRESFSLPGVTLSTMAHRGGELSAGTPGGGVAGIDLRPTVLSSRIIVGKDLLALGLAAGAGLDRVRGEGRIQSDTPAGVQATSWEALRMERRYLFLGANFTWIVAQFAGELAWAPRPDSPLDGVMGSSGSGRAGGGDLLGVLSFRVTY